MMNHLEIVRQFLANGWDANAGWDGYTYSVLHGAVAQDKFDIARLLVESRAKPSQCLLYVPAEKNSSDLVEVFLAHDWDPNFMVWFGLTENNNSYL
jgi:hypothetical protein